MRLSWLCEQDASWITLILVVAMMVAAEVGYLAGRWWHPRSEDGAKDHFAAVRNSLLGLLALLLAFSFGMSAQRYETRRQLVTEDATPLRALYLRSSLLPDPQRGQFKKLLRQYLDTRADNALIIRRDLTAEEVAQAAARSETIHSQMWELVRAMDQREPPAKGADEMLKLLIDVSTVHSKRVQAYVSRVPDPIIWLLLGTAVTALGAIGFSGGLTKHRGMLARILFTLVVCGTVFVVVEMDRPGRGVLRVDQGPMIQLKQLVDQDPESSK
jgi:hypothetical protein